jgi:hypothetical protein
MALGARGKTKEAERESKECFAGLGKLPHDAQFDPLNSVASVARVQENLVASVIKWGSRERDEEGGNEVREAFQHAVAAEDQLNYSEPPSWYPPIRPMFGRYLLEEGHAAAAEKVFRNALEKSPRYARALVGLRDSLKAQKRDYEAEQIDRQLRESEQSVDAVSTAALHK